MKSITAISTVLTKTIYIPKAPWYLRWLRWCSVEAAIQPYVNKGAVRDSNNAVKLDGTVVSSHNGQALSSPYVGQAFLLQIPIEYLSIAGQNKSDLSWAAE